MNETIPKFLKLKGRTLYFNGPGEFVFLIPEIFFERDHAIINGDLVNVIGVLNYNILKNPNDDVTKNVKFFKFPTVFLTKPGKIEKVKGLKLSDVRPAEDYRLLRYTDNGEDQIMVSIDVPEDVTNVEEFMQIFVNTGKIPTGIPYNILHELFMESMALNGKNFGITAQEFGIVASEICRDPSDLSKPYRLSKKINESMIDYQCISIKELAKTVSPFTAITTENWDEAVVSASIMPEDEIKDTPMERIMMA